MWLEISRIAGQVRKIENPETLLALRLVTIFENIILIVEEFTVFEKFANKRNLIKYSRHPITRAFKENWKRFQLPGVKSKKKTKKKRCLMFSYSCSLNFNQI